MGYETTPTRYFNKSSAIPLNPFLFKSWRLETRFINHGAGAESVMEKREPVEGSRFTWPKEDSRPSPSPWDRDMGGETRGRPNKEKEKERIE